MILARIQGHPSREHLHDPLAASLGIRCETFEHDAEPPNPWRGYKQILEARTVPYDHLLVIQDDARVCGNFGPVIEKVAARNPKNIVVLFLARLPRRISVLAARAAKRKECYLDVQLRNNEFCPAVAILWPQKKVEDFLWWVEHNPRRLGHPDPRSDDGVIGKWASLTKQKVRFTIPSLVQHPDEVPSTIGRRADWGKDRGRVAEMFTEMVDGYEW